MSVGNSYLLFQLYGPMSSWGDVAVGESRVSAALPSRSALLGMLGAATGLKRTNEEQLASLSASVRFAVLAVSIGHFMRDYHTVQVPPASVLKNRPARTRRDELSVPKNRLRTILSSRDYRGDALYRIVVESTGRGGFDLERLRQALLKPVFPLYLGRKACPPALPLQPQIIVADSVLESLQKAVFDQPGTWLSDLLPTGKSLSLDQPPYPLVWEDGMRAGVDALKTTARRDQPRTRRRWQFDERLEHRATISSLEENPCT